MHLFIFTFDNSSKVVLYSVEGIFDTLFLQTNPVHPLLSPVVVQREDGLLSWCDDSLNTGASQTQI